MNVTSRLCGPDSDLPASTFLSTNLTATTDMWSLGTNLGLLSKTTRWATVDGYNMITQRWCFSVWRISLGVYKGEHPFDVWVPLPGVRCPLGHRIRAPGCPTNNCYPCNRKPRADTSKQTSDPTPATPPLPQYRICLVFREWHFWELPKRMGIEKNISLMTSALIGLLLWCDCWRPPVHNES